MKISLYLVIVLLVSCTETEPIDNQKSTRLNINIETSGLSRATSSSLPLNSEIGLFIVEADNCEKLYYDESKYRNIRATKTIAGWQMDQEVLLKSNPAKVLAYYPYQENYTGLKISLNSETDHSFLYGRGETNVNESSPDVLIRMQSPFSIVRVWLRQSAPGSSVFATKVRLRNIDAQLYSLCTRGNVILSTPSINAAIEGPHFTEIADQGYIWFSDQYKHVDFFVFPCRMRFSEIVFEADIDNKTSQYLIQPTTWEPGKVNEYYLTYNNN